MKLLLVALALLSTPTFALAQIEDVMQVPKDGAKIYHRAGCPKAVDTVLMSFRDALAKGFEECPACAPKLSISLPPEPPPPTKPPPMAPWQGGIKVFIEVQDQPRQEWSSFTKRYRTEAAITTEEVQGSLTAQCDECSVIMKREKADFVLRFSRGRYGFDWNVFDNRGDGMSLEWKTGVMFLGNAVKDTVAVMRGVVRSDVRR